eukprot:5089778-Alexandrium_andersonii.AAC.1
MATNAAALVASPHALRARQTFVRTIEPTTRTRRRCCSARHPLRSHRAWLRLAARGIRRRPRAQP